MKYIAKLFAAAAALSFVVAGCSALQEENGLSEKREIKFTASVGSFQVKATDTAFENGDAIGLFAYYPVSVSNVRLTWQDGTLTPETPVYWGSDQLIDESAVFFGYYPYDAENDDNGRYLYFTVKEDQSTHAAYTASDLMTASTYATPAEGNVNLNFVHRLSKLVLTVENRLGDDPVKEVYVGNVAMEAEVDMVYSQNYGYGGDRGIIKAGEGVIPTKAETGGEQQAWSVIIPPQDCQPTIMVVTESGKNYVYQTDNWIYFTAACRHYGHVIIDESSISTTFSADIVDWYDMGDFWFKQDNPGKYLGDWAVIGNIQGTAWDTDFWMKQSDEYTWTTIIEYRAGEEFKFRMNGDWAVNFGAEYSVVMGDWWYATAMEDGANIRIEYDGIWCVNLNVKNREFWTYRVGDLPEEEDPSAPVKIDGDMSDWAEVAGIVDESGSSYAAFKVQADSKYLYLYSKRDTQRIDDIWGGSGYFYYAFDTDGNPETGDGNLWGNGPYEAIFVVFPFGGASGSPEFETSGNGSVSPDWCSVSKVKLAGCLSEYGVEVELRIPIADLCLPEGTPINIYTWGNKGATGLKSTPIAFTIGEPAAPVISNIAEIIANIPDTATGSSTAVEFDIDLADPVVVSYVNGKSIYIEDDSAALILFMENPGLAPGVTIKGKFHVKGYWYNGIPELVDFTAIDSTEMGYADVPLTSVTLAELLADYDKYLLRKCRINNVSVTGGIADGDRNGEIAQGSDVIAVYAQLKDKGLVLTEGATGDLVCIPGMYKTNKQLLFWQNDWFISYE